MKVLVAASLLILMVTSARAADGLYLQCSDGKTVAHAYITAQSTLAKSMTNECNMGVGDEPTGCHQVVNFYEDKKAVVSYQAGIRSIKKAFRVRRWSPTDPGHNPNRPLFSGYADVQISPGLTDQINLGESSTNPYEYSLSLIRISGHGPTAKNIGRVSLPCHTYRR